MARLIRWIQGRLWDERCQDEGRVRRKQELSAEGVDEKEDKRDKLYVDVRLVDRVFTWWSSVDFGHEAALDGAAEAAVAGGAWRRGVIGGQVEAGGFEGEVDLALGDAGEDLVFHGFVFGVCVGDRCVVIGLLGCLFGNVSGSGRE